MNKLGQFAAACAAVVCAFGAMVTGAGETLVVGEGGTYATLEAAVAAAGDGDEIIIEDGDYARTGTAVFEIAKGLNIHSRNGLGSVTIAGIGDSKANAGFKINHDEAVFSGIVLTGFRSAGGAGTADVTKDTSTGPALTLLKGKVSNCKITGNTQHSTASEAGKAYTTAAGGGVYLRGGTLENCDICGNFANRAGGVYMMGGTMRNCRVFGNVTRLHDVGGVWMTGGTLENVKIMVNEPMTATAGRELLMSGGTATGLVVFHSFNGDNGVRDVKLSGSATITNSQLPCEIAGEGNVIVSSDAYRSEPGLVVPQDGSAVAYVSSKGSNEFPYDTYETAAHAVQDAVDAVHATDAAQGTVYVDSETFYNADTTRVGTFRPCVRVNRNVKLCAYDPTGAKPVLSGLNPSTKKKAYNVLYVGHPLAVVDGFAIEDGNMPQKILGEMFYNGMPANLWLMDGTVRNCDIARGAGFCCGNVEMFGGLLENCTVSSGSLSVSGTDRQAGGVHVAGGTVTGCVLDGNMGGYGAGIFQNNSASIVSNCVIRGSTRGDNGGAGAAVLAGLMTHCVISNNTSNGAGGGVFLNGSSAKVRNCLVVGNFANGTGALASKASASSGGAGGVKLVSGTLENCTVAWNTSASSVRCDEIQLAGGTARNCIFCGKDDNAANDVNKSAGTATYCLFRTEVAGAGNLSGNPKFRSAATGDFTILYGSPAIDFGMEIAEVATDILGHARPVNEKWDMGAYEMDYSGMMVAEFSADKTAGDDSVTVTFTASVNGGTAPYVYFWTIGGKTESTTEPTYQHTFGYGSHDVTLKVTDAQGNETEPVTQVGAVKVKTGVAYVSENGSDTWPYNTWERAARYPQDAVDAVSFDETREGVVYIADGTYGKRPDSPNFILTLSNPVRVIGTNANCAARIDGAQAAIRGVSLTNPRAFLCNVTITGCKSIGYGEPPAMALGDGTVSNVVVTGNGSNGQGGVGISGGFMTDSVIRNGAGGSYVGGDRYGGGAVMTGGVLQNSVVSNCTSGLAGGVMLLTGSAVLRNCLIKDCLADSGAGGGVFAIAGTVENCEIRDCRQAGVRSDLGINSYLVATQKSGGGGAHLVSSKAVLRNCLVTGCKTEGSYDFGAAVQLVNGATFYNNTVWTNTAPKKTESRSVFATGGSAVANTLMESLTNELSTVSHCFVAATDGDPKFKSPKKAAFHLKSSSPCINAGDNSLWDGVADPVDLDGTPRIRNGIVDIGCFEGDQSGLLFIVK